MMLRIFSAILSMSLAGSVLFLLFLLLSPLFRRCFSAAWYRSALCVLLFFFAVPAGMAVRPIMEKHFTDQAIASLPFMGEVPSPLANVIVTQANGDAAMPSGMLENLPMFFAYLWLCVTAVLLMRKLVSLMRFRYHISHCIRPAEDDWILLDIPRPLDTDIYTSAAGIVTLAENTMTGYGKYLVIDHGGGYQTLYAQCNALLVEVGDEVEAGQTIAKVGRSGRATGYYLHSELRYNEDILDPEQYITPDK